MIHLACFGSIERFLGMYIEHCEGKFPLWFNPVQGVVINVNKESEEYCQEIDKIFKENKFRINLDISNNSVANKIATYSLQKIPFVIVIGNKEKENRTVTIRTLGSDKQISYSLDDFISKLNNNVNLKKLNFEL
jgi:threonyl-tRNA synthetase